MCVYVVVPLCVLVYSTILCGICVSYININIINISYIRLVYSYYSYILVYYIYEY